MAIPNEEEGKYSYADYLTWKEGERLEIIDGEIYNMSPAPSRKHQQVLRDYLQLFLSFYGRRNMKCFFAPFDVRLLTENKQNEDIQNVVRLICLLYLIRINLMTKVVTEPRI